MSDETKLWRGTGPNLIGGTAIVILVGFLGLWGTQTKISGAVLAMGQLQVETKRQIIQHPDGGVIGKINVANGDTVLSGDILIELDAADIETEIEILTGEISSYVARTARLMAERDDVPEMEPNPRPGDQVYVDAFATQQRLFRSRLDNHSKEVDQLAQVAIQTATQVQGIEAQQDAVEIQIDIVSAEVARQEELESKDLTTSRAIASVRSQEADLRGQAGSLTAEIGRLNSRIAQIEIERTRLSVARQEGAIAELAEISARLREAESRLTAAQRRLQRLKVTSPVDGVVFDLQVNAIQSVVGPGSVLAYIVPQDRDLIVSARVSESDIDQLTFEQDVNLRFSALDTRFTPTISGTVERISADILIDENSGLQYYEAEIRPRPEDLALLGDQKIVPGMPVEAYIQTGDRTPLEYLIKPLADYFYRAFRHD